MKKIITLLIILAIIKISFAQNVGIGTNTPAEKLTVFGGNFLVQQSTYGSTNVTRTETMVNNTNIYVSNVDSAYRVYDPGGPGGNYLDNTNCTVSFSGQSAGTIGYEIIIESMQINTGDSLIITSGNGVYLLTAGNNNNIAGTYTIRPGWLNIIFKSNGDGQIGAGFSLLIKRLYSQNTAPLKFAAGNTLSYDIKKSIFRAGAPINDIDSLGDYSASFGKGSAIGNYSLSSGLSKAAGISSSALGKSIALNDYSSSFGESYSNATYATSSGQSIAHSSYSSAFGNSEAGNSSFPGIGIYATAMGNSTASYFFSTAMGQSTASGGSSTAMGNSNASNGGATAMGQSTASGGYSTAMGRGNASGYTASALGDNVTASGNNSHTMGTDMSTNNYSGSFAFGDGGDFDQSHIFGNDKANEMLMRFIGGYRLYTTGWGASGSLGVSLPAGANAWFSMSDKNKKENFEDLNSEDILNKIASVKYTSWNYKGQDPKIFRHYGIMAQDFYNAFGKDQYGTIGCDTLVNPIDMMGIAYSAIQGLEKRTQKIEDQQKQILELQKTNAVLIQQNEKLLIVFEKLNQKVELLANAKEENNPSTFTKNK